MRGKTYDFAVIILPLDSAKLTEEGKAAVKRVEDRRSGARYGLSDRGGDVAASPPREDPDPEPEVASPTAPRSLPYGVQ